MIDPRTLSTGELVRFAEGHLEQGLNKAFQKEIVERLGTTDTPPQEPEREGAQYRLFS
jgi:hypothetical protein